MNPCGGSSMLVEDDTRMTVVQDVDTMLCIICGSFDLPGGEGRPIPGNLGPKKKQIKWYNLLPVTQKGSKIFGITQTQRCVHVEGTSAKYRPASRDLGSRRNHTEIIFWGSATHIDCKWKRVKGAIARRCFSFTLP